MRRMKRCLKENIRSFNTSHKVLVPLSGTSIKKETRYEH